MNGMRSTKKNRNGKTAALILAGCMALSMLAGCGSSRSQSYDSAYKSSSVNSAAAEAAYADDAYYDSYDYEESYDMAMYDNGSAAGASSITTENASTSNRKLIRNASLTVETKEFDALLISLDERIKSLGGYVENMSGNYGSRYSSYRSGKSAYITARIPADKLDGFIGAVGEEANITNKSESVTDVTLDYVDMESHKKMLKEEQDRLLEFLEQAETIEDIITIEDRLAEVRYQLESMESQLRTYDNKIDYSTVTIDVREVIDYTVVVEEEKTPVERMKEGFVRSVRSIGIGLREFGIWFVINLPYIILIAVIAVIALIIIRIAVKKNEKKREAKKEERTKKRAEAIARGEDPDAGKADIYVSKPGKIE